MLVFVTNTLNNKPLDMWMALNDTFLNHPILSTIIYLLYWKK